MKYGLPLSEVKKLLREGEYAWPGGYPRYFILADGAPASFAGVRKYWKHICHAHICADGQEPEWEIAACEINWEGDAGFCELTNDLIPSAY